MVGHELFNPLLYLNDVFNFEDVYNEEEGVVAAYDENVQTRQCGKQKREEMLQILQNLNA